REPRRARTVPRALREHARDRRAIAVDDRRAGPRLDPPARGGQAEAEVRVAARAGLVGEAADGGERLAPDGAVRGLRERPALVAERDLLAHRRLQPRVAQRGGPAP